MPSGVVARWAHRKACVVLGVAGPVVGPAATTTPRGVCLGATTPAEWFGRHALVARVAEVSAWRRRTSSPCLVLCVGMRRAALRRYTQQTLANVHESPG